MKMYHLIRVKNVSSTNTKETRVKLTSLRFPNDSLTLNWDYRVSDMIKQSLESLKMLKYKIDGYGYDETKGDYIICSNTFEPLREKQKEANLLSERGWHKDHNNYNKAEKWERTPAKRKTPARNVVKKATTKRVTTKRK